MALGVPGLTWLHAVCEIDRAMSSSSRQLIVLPYHTAGFEPTRAGYFRPRARTPQSQRSRHRAAATDAGAGGRAAGRTADRLVRSVGRRGSAARAVSLLRAALPRAAGRQRRVGVGAQPAGATTRPRGLL